METHIRKAYEFFEKQGPNSLNSMHMLYRIVSNNCIHSKTSSVKMKNPLQQFPLILRKVHVFICAALYMWYGIYLRRVKFKKITAKIKTTCRNLKRISGSYYSKTLLIRFILCVLVDKRQILNILLYYNPLVMKFFDLYQSQCI